MECLKRNDRRVTSPGDVDDAARADRVAPSDGERLNRRTLGCLELIKEGAKLTYFSRSFHLIIQNHSNPIIQKSNLTLLNVVKIEIYLVISFIIFMGILEFTEFMEQNYIIFRLLLFINFKNLISNYHL